MRAGSRTQGQPGEKFPLIARREVDLCGLGRGVLREEEERPERLSSWSWAFLPESLRAKRSLSQRVTLVFQPAGWGLFRDSVNSAQIRHLGIGQEKSINISLFLLFSLCLRGRAFFSFSFFPPRLTLSCKFPLLTPHF